MLKKYFYQEMSQLKVEQFLTGNNFANNSDIIYAQAVDIVENQNLEKNNFENYITIDENICIYSIKNFQLKENDVIFCKTDFVLELFAKLQNINQVSNLKLITHQAATPAIDKTLFKLKPKCISEWYSINVTYKNKKLFPIPLGLANDFSKGNLHPSDYLKIYSAQKIYEGIPKIYCNFNPTTNSKRKMYLNYANENKNFHIESVKKNNLDYLIDLFNFNYVLSPPGTGLDTHRFWEVLYAGNTPAAEKNLIYDVNFLNYYMSFEKVNELDLKLDSKFLIDKTLIDLLNIDNWIKKIKSNRIDSSVTIFVNINRKTLNKRIKKLKKKYSKMKILNARSNLKTKIIELYRMYFKFNDNLFKKYWN